MRTKSILTALCLPLAFTACTNDEFLSEDASLDARGKIDVVLAAAKPEVGAETRMGINSENKFTWEKDIDMLGAAMVNGANPANVGNDVYVNYPFVADQSGTTSTFSSKSSITQGLYVFYYSYKDVLDRKGLPLGAPKQEYDASSTKSALEQAANYMGMVSPIINLAKGVTYEKAKTYNLGLKFVNLYTPVRVDIASSNIPEGVAPKVTKVTFDKKTSDDYNTSSWYLDAAAKFADVWPAAVDLNEDGSIKSNDLETALEALETKVMDGSIYSDKKANGENASTGAFTLNVKGDVVLTNGTTTSLWIMVPKGSVEHFQLKVHTTEGVYTRNVSPENAVEFKNNVVGVDAKLNFATDGSGNVILPATFLIGSTEDWDAAVKFMTDHAVGYLNKNAAFELTKDVTVNRLPVFSLDISKATGVANNPILTLGSDFTFTSDNKNQFKFTDVNLAVGEGATLTVNAAPANILTSITNLGTLNVNTSMPNAIINWGEMNVNADAKLSGGLTNGREYNNSDPTNIITAIAGTVNIAASKKLTLETRDSENLVGTIKTVGAESSLDWGSTKLTNKATIENHGLLEGTRALVNSGTVDNYGNLMPSVDNSGKVIIESGSVSGTTIEDGGTITGGTAVVMDISSFSTLQQDQNVPRRHYKFGENTKVTTLVSNAVEYEQADVNDVGITDITLNCGEWKLTSTSGTTTSSKEIAKPEATKVVGITLKNAKLTMTTGGTELPENLSVEGTSVLTTDQSTATVTGSLTVEKDATFTVEKGIVMNALSTNENIATINGNTTINAGAELYFRSAKVGKDTTLKVLGNNKNVDKAGVFAVALNRGFVFENSGTVRSEASTKSSGTKTPGQVSQPTNMASGTFVGNATTFSFTNGTTGLENGTVLTAETTYVVYGNCTIGYPTADGAILKGSGTVTIKGTIENWESNKLNVLSKDVKLVLINTEEAKYVLTKSGNLVSNDLTTILPLSNIVNGVKVDVYYKDESDSEVKKVTATKGESSWTFGTATVVS